MVRGPPRATDCRIYSPPPQGVTVEVIKHGDGKTFPQKGREHRRPRAPRDLC